MPSARSPARTEKYTSPIPEPFTFIPEEQRSIALADGSITSSFLECSTAPRATPAWNPSATIARRPISGCTCSTRRTSCARSTRAPCCARCGCRRLPGTMSARSTSRCSPAFPPTAEMQAVQNYAQTGPVKGRDKIRHPNLDVGRPVAPGHLRSESPEAGYDYCGPLTNPIATNVSGIEIGELLPLLAKQADKYSIIRSMTHGNNGHETASYMVQTGRAGRRRGLSVRRRRGLAVQGLRRRLQGADSALHRADRTAGAFSEAGFPGIALQAVRHRRRPGAGPFAVEGRGGPGITDQRQKDRRELLHKLNTLEQAMPAIRFLAASRRPKTGLRPDPGRRRQGVRSVAGEGRTARPLRPQHLRPVLPGGAAAGRARRPLCHHQLQGRLGHAQAELPGDAPKLPEMDKGMATLLQDLSERGLLDSTIVWWGGEFGRTPKVHVGSALERRAESLGQRLLRRGRRRRFQGRPRGRRVGCQRRRGQGPARLSVRSHRQHLRAAGHRPRWPERHQVPDPHRRPVSG
jgi:hypothetical protein